MDAEERKALEQLARLTLALNWMSANAKMTNISVEYVMTKHKVWHWLAYCNIDNRACYMEPGNSPSEAMLNAMSAALKAIRQKESTA